MLVCRPRCLAGLSAFNISPVRPTSTSASTCPPFDQPTDKPQDSIFTAPESPWDHVFSDIEPVPPLSPTQRLRTRLNNDHNANSGSGFTTLSGRRRGQNRGQNQSLVQRASEVRHQRASITTREMSVFNEMFDLIFNAMSTRRGGGTSLHSGLDPSSSPSTSSFSGQPSIGHAGVPLNDLFRTLRRQTSRVRWTTAIDEELDRKKETMELFNTDHELLQWVMIDLFGESQQRDEEAKGATATSSLDKTKGEGKGSVVAASSTDAATASSTLTLSSSKPPEGHPINHSIYPHLIAHAMRIFRTTYANPSLSLAIFNHAAHVSIPSYVFGCTAPVYNELIEAKWEGWCDLEGVCNALEEMRANGIKIDGRTRIVVEKVRREVGEARPAELGSPGLGMEDEDANFDSTKEVNPLARKVWGELGEVEVMRLLHRIERLALRDRSRKSASSPHEESWKSAVLQPSEDDGWSFDGWDKEKKTGDRKKQRWKAKLEPVSQDQIHSQTLGDWTTLGTAKETVFR